jgi:hypothetical protein
MILVQLDEKLVGLQHTKYCISSFVATKRTATADKIVHFSAFYRTVVASSSTVNVAKSALTSSKVVACWMPCFLMNGT